MRKVNTPLHKGSTAHSENKPCTYQFQGMSDHDSHESDCQGARSPLLLSESSDNEPVSDDSFATNFPHTSSVSGDDKSGLTVRWLEVSKVWLVTNTSNNVDGVHKPLHWSAGQPFSNSVHRSRGTVIN